MCAVPEHTEVITIYDSEEEDSSWDEFDLDHEMALAHIHLMCEAHRVPQHTRDVAELFFQRCMKTRVSTTPSEEFAIVLLAHKASADRTSTEEFARAAMGDMKISGDKLLKAEFDVGDAMGWDLSLPQNLTWQARSMW